MTIDLAASQPGDAPFSAGTFEVSGQRKFTKTYDLLDQHQFFGFRSTNEEIDNSLVDTFIVDYDPALFLSLKDIIQNSLTLIAATELNIQAAIDGQIEWNQIAFYEKVIEADVVTGLEKVFPISTYVYRPEEAQADRLQLNAQRAQIDSEKAAIFKAFRDTT